MASHVQERFIRLRSVRNKFAIAVAIATDLPFRRRISSDELLSVYVHGDHFVWGSVKLDMNNSSVGTSPIQ